jgi:hypothetical protein
VKFAGVLELLAPGDTLFTVDSLEQLSQGFCLFLTSFVCNDLNDKLVFLRDFNNCGIGVVKFESKDFIAFLLLVFVLENLNGDRFGALLVIEFKNAFDGFVIDIGLGLLVSAAKWDGLVLNANLTVDALHAFHFHHALALVGGVPHRLLLFEDEHAGLVVVQDRHAGARVLSNQFITGYLVVQLHVEVFGRLPTGVGNDLNLNFSISLSALKDDRLVNCVVVIAILCVSINCRYVHCASSLVFV